MAARSSNWWWDPEATAIVMRQHWPQVVVMTPYEAGAQPFSAARPSCAGW